MNINSIDIGEKKKEKHIPGHIVHTGQSMYQGAVALTQNHVFLGQ